MKWIQYFACIKHSGWITFLWFKTKNNFGFYPLQPFSFIPLFPRFLPFLIILSWIRKILETYYVKGTLCLKKSTSFQPSCLRRKNSDESWNTALAVVCRPYAQWMKFQKIVWFSILQKLLNEDVTFLQAIVLLWYEWILEYIILLEKWV